MRKIKYSSLRRLHGEITLLISSDFRLPLMLYCPVMSAHGDLSILKTLFGTGKGSGAALMMLILGVSGSLICIITGKNERGINIEALKNARPQASGACILYISKVIRAQTRFHPCRNSADTRRLTASQRIRRFRLPLPRSFPRRSH